MIRATLALLIRALRDDAKLLRFHLMRMFFVLVIFISVLFAWGMSRGTTVAPGLNFFASITWMNTFLITLAGIGFFSTAITEEKEEATLGLLQMAGISRTALLLGKSTSRALSVLMLLSVQFPFTLLAITLGGVTFGQIFAAYLALLAYMFMLSNVALMCSVLFKRSWGAAMSSTVLLSLFLFIPPLITQTAQVKLQARFVFDVAEKMIEASIFQRVGVIMGTGFNESALSWQVISNLCASAFFFLVSWLSFGTYVDESKSATASRGLVMRPTGRLGFLAPRRTWRRALFWKDFHFMTGGTPAIILKLHLFALVLLYFFLPSILARDIEIFARDRASIGSSIMWIMFGLIVAELCFYASRIYHVEVKWQTLATLMVLPISNARLAYSKIAGCLVALLPALFYFLMGAIIYPNGFLDAMKNTVGQVGSWIGICLFFILLHLTVLLSLYLRWGAFLMSVVAVFFGSIVLWFIGGCCVLIVIAFARAYTSELWVQLLLAFFGFAITVGINWLFQLVISRKIMSVAAR